MRDTPILINLPCIKCGYNLRTRPLYSRCPECGEEVVKALSAWPYRSGRIHRLIRGIRVIALLNTTLLIVAALFLAHRSLDTRRWPIENDLPLLLFRCFSLYSVLLMFAIWTITALPLTGIVRRTGNWLRASSVCFAFAHVGPLLAITTIVFNDAVLYVWLVLLPSICVLHYHLGVYIEEIAWSCGFPRLARLNLIASTALAIGLAVWEVTALLHALLPGPEPLVLLIYYASILTTTAALALTTFLHWRLATRLRYATAS